MGKNVIAYYYFKCQLSVNYFYFSLQRKLCRLIIGDNMQLFSRGLDLEKDHLAPIFDLKTKQYVYYKGWEEVSYQKLNRKPKRN